jgi:DNA polymerase-3 subunit delta'
MQQPELDEWLIPYWQRVEERLTNNKLPHALLITGAQGIGKEQLARKIIRHLVCKTNHSACGSCSGCNLLAAGSHPDYLELMPEAKGKQIKIDAIRKVLTFSSTTAQMDGNKVIFITPAENMNINAANALLKCLEEPNDGSFLVLISERSSALLPTIRSRCQVIDVTQPNKEIASQWLTQHAAILAGGFDNEKISLALALTAYSPYQALELLQSDGLEMRQRFFDQLRAMLNKQIGIVEVAEKWHKNSILDISGWLLSTLQDVLKKGMAGSETQITNTDMVGFINVLSTRMSTRVLSNLIDDLLLIRQQLLSGKANPNTQMLLEKHLCGWLTMQ